jgi:hypothetical protein
VTIRRAETKAPAPTGPNAVSAKIRRSVGRVRHDPLITDYPGALHRRFW